MRASACAHPHVPACARGRGPFPPPVCRPILPRSPVHLSLCPSPNNTRSAWRWRWATIWSAWRASTAAELLGEGDNGWKTPGFPELLVAYTCLKVGLVEQRTRTTMHSLRLSAEGAAMTGGHGGSGYWGLLASAPFFRCLPRFHSLCESDGLPQAVRSP